MWLNAALAGPAVLVTVAIAEGSVPREAGAHMLVTADAQADTIGGGHLELCALEVARAMLRDAAASICYRSAGAATAALCAGPHAGAVLRRRGVSGV
jgi:xanthine dehydrogenase accessory factor